jgi:phospholipid/cholesterol/gamma-HCH transport system permease protein
MTTFIGKIGENVIIKARATSHFFALFWGVILLACKRSSWPRTTRDVFMRQILFTGVEALKFVSLVAIITGLSVVIQAQIWLGKTGQSQMLGTILVTVIVRELAPLLVNFIIIGRSGTAIAVELANMKVLGEIHLLESQGMDPLLYLIIPRAIAMSVCVFCLTIWFIFVSFGGGYLYGILAEVGAGAPNLFIMNILRAIHLPDVISLLTKTLLPGLFTAIICASEGISVGEAITEVPQAATRAVVRSIAVLFIVSVIVSILTYS